MDTRFIFTRKYRLILSMTILTGIAAIIVYLVFSHDHGQRFWSNFLMNNVYFIFISLSGMVFLSLHALGTSGWQTSIQRVPEAMWGFLPVGLLFFIIILAGMWTGNLHIFHWTDPDPGDKIIELKKAYLNIPFFSIRTILYIAGWMIFAWLWRKNSLLQDANASLKYFKRTNTIAALFMVFFAISSSMAAWDWLMSLEPHWFSTLYGWYVFSSFLVSGIAMMILIVIFLKSRGLMKHVNKEHLHDLGIYLFAFSVFWAYLWFSQYMLIWYGNIPEETVYYIERLNHYKPAFYLNLVLNFVVPFFALMARNSKRTPVILGLTSVVVLAGHWIDFYLMVMPGATGSVSVIGFAEIGMTIVFTGLFLWAVFHTLSKASLIPANHPFFKESLEYHTQY